MSLPAIHDVVDVGGVSTQILAMKDTGVIIVLGHRVHPVHPFATWILDEVNGAYYSGHYWDTRDKAEDDFANRF